MCDPIGGEFCAKPFGLEVPIGPPGTCRHTPTTLGRLRKLHLDVITA